MTFLRFILIEKMNAVRHILLFVARSTLNPIKQYRFQIGSRGFQRCGAILHLFVSFPKNPNVTPEKCCRLREIFL